MNMLHKCPSETYVILWYVCFLHLIALEDSIYEWCIFKSSTVSSVEKKKKTETSFIGNNVQ